MNKKTNKKMIWLIIFFLIIGILLGLFTSIVIKGNATNIFKNVDDSITEEKDSSIVCNCNGKSVHCYRSVGCSTCCLRDKYDNKPIIQ